MASMDVEGRTDPSPDATTQNLAPSYSTSGEHRLDFFYKGLVRDCAEESLQTLLAASWHEHPENTVQLICHARDCRGGKGEKKVVYHCLKWLRSSKPKTYQLNLAKFIDCGYFKDLLQIACFVTAEMPQLGEHEMLELEFFCNQLKVDLNRLEHFERGEPVPSDPRSAAKEEQPDVEGMVDEKSDGGDEDDDDMEGQEGVDKDQPPMKKKKLALSLSLAGKWAPSEKGHFDKEARLAKRMRKIIFGDSKSGAKQYRKMLTKLRTHLKIVEQLICSKRWNEIDFGKVPSRAHKIYKNSFQKHDETRYALYLGNVKEGKAKINVAGIQPHELVDHYYRHQPLNETIEVQWTALVDRVRSSGKFDSAIAVVDVSGSMTVNNALPLRVAIALGLITSEVTKEPFKGFVITFSTRPKFHKVQGNTLKEKYTNVSTMDWDGSTDVQKVFRLILDFATNSKLPKFDMPKILFIFSDMQFDQATRNGNTNYQEAVELFRAAGYICPQIVFWNLSGSITDVPVAAETPGVSLISGFSSELLKLFIEGGEISPLDIMLKAVESYKVEIHPDEL